MKIRKVMHNKKEYMELLLLADEQEDMIDRYLEQGICLFSGGRRRVGGMRGDEEGDRVYELKNIAVAPVASGGGMRKQLISLRFSIIGTVNGSCWDRGRTLFAGFITAAALRPPRLKTFYGSLWPSYVLRMGKR